MCTPFEPSTYFIQLNCFQQETRGGCISIETTKSKSEKDDVNGDDDNKNDENTKWNNITTFCYLDHCCDVNASIWRSILKNFIDKAISLDKELKGISDDPDSDFGF